MSEQRTPSQQITDEVTSWEGVEAGPGRRGEFAFKVGRRDWAALSGSWEARIDERIAELERLRAGLTECIGCGCLSLDRCQLANPGDRAARRGAGPRYWIRSPIR